MEYTGSVIVDFILNNSVEVFVVGHLINMAINRYKCHAVRQNVAHRYGENLGCNVL